MPIRPPNICNTSSTSRIPECSKSACRHKSHRFPTRSAIKALKRARKSTLMLCTGSPVRRSRAGKALQNITVLKNQMEIWSMYEGLKPRLSLIQNNDKLIPFSAHVFAFFFWLPGRLNVHALVSIISISSRNVASEYVGSVS